MSKNGMPLKEKLIGKMAELMIKKIDDAPIIAPLTKELSASRVALVTTAGVHVKGQELFDTKDGDHTFRIIPSTAPAQELIVTHGHYDQSEAEKDINCVFPIERLHELQQEGFIGSIAANHYGFMGYIPNINSLIEESAPKAAKLLKEDNVDIVILSAG